VNAVHVTVPRKAVGLKPPDGSTLDARSVSRRIMLGDSVLVLRSW
jgi:hypothetical protein